MILKDVVKKRLVMDSEDSYELLEGLVDRSEDSLGHKYIRSKAHIDIVLFINWNRGALSRLKRLEVTSGILGELC
jgi:hypothetical protein